MSFEQYEKTMFPAIDDTSNRESGILKLSSRQLETWPEQIPASTTNLNIDHNNLVEIPTNITELPSLEILSAIGNDIETLSSDIGEVNTLKELHLTENCLTRLPDTICKLKSLTRLTLLGNNIVSLPDDIGSLSSLKHLDLSENRLGCLPQSFISLTNLEFFDASDNDIKTLPHLFGQLSKLKNLNLSNNGLQTLPETFGELCSIEFLDLTSNSISEFPPVFKSSSCIKEMYIEQNYIHTLPSWFGTLSCVSKLCLSDNSLTGESALPEDIGDGCPLLEHLDLSGNQIASFPDSIVNLQKLKFLDMGSILPELERKVELLNGNMLQTLPSGFGCLCNLVELRLDENHLTELPEDIGGLISLEILDLGQDCLRSLPDSFCDLSKLHTCSLAMNSLSDLPENIGNLTNLVFLRLEQNCLTRLPQSFVKLCKLEYLNLFYNQLEVFPPLLLELSNLQTLNIERNKFKLKDAPNIYKCHVYPSRDPLLSDNWRGKCAAHDIHEGEWDGGECHYVGNEDISSEEDDNDNDSQRAAENKLSTWGSSLSEGGSESPAFRSISPLIIDDSDDRDSAPSSVSVVVPFQPEDDWDSCDVDENPYGLPRLYQHPIKRSNGFVPAELHRPSYVYLFHKTASQPAKVDEGQFDNVDTELEG